MSAVPRAKSGTLRNIACNKRKVCNAETQTDKEGCG